MLSIFVKTEDSEKVEKIIKREFRLDELIEIKDIFKEKPTANAYTMMIKEGDIKQPIDWQNVLPPFILSDAIPLSTENLLGLIFMKLGNYEKAYNYLDPNRVLLNDVDIINRLQNGIPTDPSVLTSDFSPFDEYRFFHNQAILRHYASTDESFDLDKTVYFYKEALLAAPDDEHKAFTAKHYTTFLLDTGFIEECENTLLQAIHYALSDEAKMELKATLCACWLKKLVVPYDSALLAHLKDTLWEVLQHYEKQGRQAEVGLLLIDASHVANISDSFSESLGYISRAIDIFRKEELPELYANAQLRRGTLLYTWAKNGNPQFFKGAMDSYQEALKIFTREETPSVFADIHHHLGVIYSEIPDEIKRKSLWAAVSSSSFQEALNIYNKENHPYEYAMVCNSYGNAMTKYPQAIHSDNFEKALFYYQEALNIRTASAYPLERALTLLNYLEACWYVNNGTEEFNEARFNDMKEKANEIKKLTDDEKLLAEAQTHLDKLAELEKAFTAKGLKVG